MLSFFKLLENISTIESAFSMERDEGRIPLQSNRLDLKYLRKLHSRRCSLSSSHSPPPAQPFLCGGEAQLLDRDDSSTTVSRVNGTA